MDTSRDELRERIALAGRRFDRLVRAADPLARPPGMDWTVQQIAAHVLTLGYRYRQVARGRDYFHAADARGIADVNQAELEAAMAPVSELADELRRVAAELDSFFDATTDDERPFRFMHSASCLALLRRPTGSASYFCTARTSRERSGAPWQLPERDMLLVLRGAREMVPLYVRPEVPADTDVCVAFEIPEARPTWFTSTTAPPRCVNVGQVTALMRFARARIDTDAAALPTDRPVTALRRGLRLVGGRRPWVALKLVSYFDRP